MDGLPFEKRQDNVEREGGVTCCHCPRSLHRSLINRDHAMVSGKRMHAAVALVQTHTADPDGWNVSGRGGVGVS